MTSALLKIHNREFYMQPNFSPDSLEYIYIHIYFDIDIYMSNHRIATKYYTTKMCMKMRSKFSTTNEQLTNNDDEDDNDTDYEMKKNQHSKQHHLLIWV